MLKLYCMRYIWSNLSYGLPEKYSFVQKKCLSHFWRRSRRAVFHSIKCYQKINMLLKLGNIIFWYDLVEWDPPILLSAQKWERQKLLIVKSSMDLLIWGQLNSQLLGSFMINNFRHSNIWAERRIAVVHLINCYQKIDIYAEGREVKLIIWRGFQLFFVIVAWRK